MEVGDVDAGHAGIVRKRRPGALGRMLDFRAMDITLRAPGTPIDALLLESGLHALGRAPEGGLHLIDDAAEARVWIRVDRAGTWLGVADGVRGVHVNGRPVRRRALLRAGDSVHVDGVEIVLAGSAAAPASARASGGGEIPAPDPALAGDADPRVVLRGVGGRHHGRSFTLGAGRTVGSAADADICLDDPVFAPRHARIAGEGGQVVLRALQDDAPVVVNGVSCRQAVLRPGDQVAFDAGQRFVVEAPLAAVASAGEASLPMGDGEVPASAPPATARRLPLLLFAALLLAAGLWALLLL
jgi:pSer/pThr/pTyr-binding forkhead associated (FHA) protein